MDLQKPLQELVAKVPGALGAILIDNEGEAVTYFLLPTTSGSVKETERIRLIGAYDRVWINDCIALAQQFQLGSFNNLVHKYEYGVVLAKPIIDNHALILLTVNESYVGQGLLHLNEAALQIEADL